MHLRIPTILAISTTLASTMALPTTSTSSSTELEKRFHYGWVGSFDNSDCSGDPNPLGVRPELDYENGVECDSFQYVIGDWIGINYGTGAYSWAGATFYSDSQCQNVSSLNSYHTVVPGPNGMACIFPPKGTVINSVQGTNWVEPKE